MKDSTDFINAYYEFKTSVDFSQIGILPELDSLVWCLLLGVPEVPADDDSSPEASFRAIDQRAAILKAVFIEVNSSRPDEFIDQGLERYDQASRMARKYLDETSQNR